MFSVGAIGSPSDFGTQCKDPGVVDGVSGRAPPIVIVSNLHFTCGALTITDGSRPRPRILVFSSIMGRPKVLPANRLRANTACTACRASKKRCSGSFPCTSCIHKGQGRTCMPFKLVAGESRSRHPSATCQATDTIPAATRSSWGEASTNFQSPPPTSIHETSPHGRSVEQSLEAGSRSPEATHRTHPRMLRNLQGERVYVGKAASLSFLQLLRETVTQHIGPSQFSHNFKSEDMLETEAHHDSPNFSEDCCDSEQKSRFLQRFRTVTSGFLDLGYNPDALLSDPEDPQTDREKTHAAIPDLMIAIGAQSCPKDPEMDRIERFFFTRGQQRTFANFLEDPSLDLVRVFLLMSFYMFGACRRNASFMYLGVAARSAVALGLHADSSESLNENEQQERSRLWMSLCVIDLLASSILGRPAATVGLLPESRKDLDRITSNPTVLSLVASYRLSLILDEIVSRLYSEKSASIETANSLLAKLTRWSGDLPESLRTAVTEDEDREIVQERIIGNMHVACSYHFAVILVTRPFLISTLSVRLARLHQSLSTGVVSEALEEDPAHSRLAVACIDSAVYMLQTCLEVHQSGLLLQQMALLKAFVFAAALVLGFSMFSHRDVDAEIDGAFTGALVILRMLARQSAQAAHYFEILTLLEAAVSQQRQRLSAQARHRRSQYVSRIFSLSEATPTPRMEDGGRDDMTSSLLAQGGAFYPWLPAHDNGSATVTPPITDSAFLDWEGMELPLWDSFPFTEPGSSVL
ncbi:hypothetical protein N7462_005253 [Penicillium macrosclerotiorum]|uniref:uncharacterized protein n=1 Tax=Penicillium macrosclerotiorum TaxID=303699 RepID=UPI002548FDAB|nr:uncharacterized protein N7462_005253 [Penicillium macrosclerotiorum]KAJ5690861.1 hypothetical protein N7462_005253 [Penicillium macrosclerotiorum]